MAALTLGAHHIGLTIPDIEATRAFFVDALGFEEVGRMPDYPAVFVSDGTSMITLWQTDASSAPVPFDRRRNVGLHHLALKANPEPGLDEIGRLLAARDDVTMEFAPEPAGKSGARHLMCFIPGGVRLELIGA